jgi:hypothetical protein
MCTVQCNPDGSATDRVVEASGLDNRTDVSKR